MLFKGPYAFLSNMYTCNVEGYPCVESMFQAEKCKLGIEKGQFKFMNGYAAKAQGRRVILRPDWEMVKVDVMRSVLKCKFKGELLERLKAIEEDIIEHNTWGDTFWGVCNGVGNNMLGKLLMELRDND